MVERVIKTKTEGAGKIVINSLLKRAVIKDARGGIRVDGVDLESSEVGNVLRLIIKGTDGLVSRDIKRTLENLTRPPHTLSDNFVLSIRNGVRKPNQR
ncbi:hypothetical protein A3A76_00700 [Candidatus Woesebacteria bacterium RIFCSPLOWO2_01_FULL_39_23]|uniref:Uncharacterized protein n=1 Tax=Candidatus Woesebacteria bacterium RIFCSPHIGHO2_01_FULL_40_22 TaxID=1802499 RepID=A0A1F7YJQ7_9BACT|nr:MAG: hypothetical protein A2141_05345 [Candidatus Woesebacteria bacterium RBG_16_40_11]OGM26765.1 MAG: hypothetical protein A2628_04375 [Candidatus Woesebacteria bacterium RIFCSPHIGHO2_01_FULL_40_22]OGM38606.1 MAG: hypothetical protein A3E41_00060 [Candidatus Woesebacteria bacterium RIFCSPHIGHO2_12_FULL_38_9]OGM63061.1 MAG: hypothetical protein A3A76_00700 [Candidatus Woesebacteria bacterium RIFCSPLOWO2_01_FULL_39_23]